MENGSKFVTLVVVPEQACINNTPQLLNVEGNKWATHSYQSDMQPVESTVRDPKLQNLIHLGNWIVSFDD